VKGGKRVGPLGNLTLKKVTSKKKLGYYISIYIGVLNSKLLFKKEKRLRTPCRFWKAGRLKQHPQKEEKGDAERETSDFGG